VFDTVDSFGRGLTTGLAALPTSFITVGTPLLAGGCVFGTKPGTGQCLTAQRLIGTANFRNRGVFGLLSGQRGRTRFGAGIGYSNRRFLAGRNAVDQNYIAEAYFMRKLTWRSSLRGDLFAGRYTSNSPGLSRFGRVGRSSIIRSC
jgi:hypothetical protein